MRRHALSTLVVLCATFAAVAPARAQDPRPEPGCAGLAVTDKKGDSTVPATDILAAWFTHAGGKTHANIRIANLARAVAADSTWLNYSMTFTSSTGSYLLYAYTGKDGSTAFRYKTLTPIPGGAASRYVDTAAVPGKFFDGKEGVVQFEIPAAIAPPGKDLKDIFVDADDVALGHPTYTYVLYTTRSDNTDDVKSTPYNVAECPAPEPEKQEAAEAPPASPPPPPPPNPPVQPAPSEQPPMNAQPEEESEPKKAKKKPTCKQKAKKKFKGKKNAKKRAKALRACKKKARRKRR